MNIDACEEASKHMQHQIGSLQVPISDASVVEIVVRPGGIWGDVGPVHENGVCRCRDIVRCC